MASAGCTCRASITLLLMRLVSTSSTVADSHFTWCLVSHVCTAIPFFQSFLYCSPVYSQLPLQCPPSFANVYMVALTAGHLIPHSVHFQIWRTVATLTFTSASLSFPMLSQITWTPCMQDGDRNVQFPALDVWQEQRLWFGSFCLHSVVEVGCLLRMFINRWSGYPLATKTWRRWVS